MRVLIIEDHAGTREGVVRVLSRRGFRALGAGSRAEARAALEPAPDVVLVDLHLGEESGVDAIRELSERGLACVAFTVADDGPTVLAALAAGARGYVLKDDPGDRVVGALEEVASGRTPISGGVAHHLVRAIRPTPPEVDLTEREREVLVALARGLTYGESASALGIGLGTIQTHVKRIYRKLNVTSKTEACAWAIRHGLVE